MKNELTDSAVLNLLREKVEIVGSMRKVAAQSDLSVGYISDVLLGRRAIGPKLAGWLGLEREVTKTTVVTYRRKPKVSK